MSSSSRPASSPAPDKDTAKESMAHFATAYVFLLLGLAALVWNSGRLASGDFADPRVIGGLHFITLGWLSLSIFGALRVFTGVALGSQGFGKGLVPWTRYLWTMGTAIFPLGLMFEMPLLIKVGTPLIGLALLLFSVHMVPALVQARRSGLTKWFLAIAIVSLWGAYLLGYSAAMVRAGIFVVPLVPGYFSAHILLAVFGWVGGTVVGVGSHLIPMFALSKETNQIPLKGALSCWAMIPLFAGLGAFLEGSFLNIGWTLAGIGSVLWIIQVFIYLKERLRKEHDPGLMMAGGATSLLGLAWMVFLLTDASISFVGLVLIGWLTLFTLGIYHRVIPFLVWFARFARSIGKSKVPKVKDLIDRELGIATTVLSLVGALLWGTGLIEEHAYITFGGAALILMAATLSLGQIRTLIGKNKEIRL